MIDFQQHINNMKASKQAGQYFYDLDLPATDKIELFNHVLQEDRLCRVSNAIYFLSALSKLHHSTADTAQQVCELLKEHEHKIIHLMKKNKDLFEMTVLLIIRLKKASPKGVSELLNHKTSEFCFFEKIQHILLDPAQPFEHALFNSYKILFQNHSILSIQHLEILHLHARFDNEAAQHRDELWKDLMKSYKAGELDYPTLRNITHTLLERSTPSFSSDLTWVMNAQQFALEHLNDRELNHFMTILSLQSTKGANKKIDSSFYVENTLLLINKQLHSVNSPNQFHRVLKHLGNLQAHLLHASNRLALTESYIHLVEKLLKKVAPSQTDAKEKIQRLFTLTHDEKTLTEIISHDRKNAVSSKAILTLIQSNLLPLSELEKLKDWKNEITTLITGSSDREKLLSSIFNEPESTLYQYMRIKRGWKTPSVETGCLRACYMKAQELGVLPKVSRSAQSTSSTPQLYEMTLFSGCSTSGITLPKHRVS